MPASKAAMARRNPLPPLPPSGPGGVWGRKRRNGERRGRCRSIKDLGDFGAAERLVGVFGEGPHPCPGWAVGLGVLSPPWVPVPCWGLMCLPPRLRLLQPPALYSSPSGPCFGGLRPVKLGEGWGRGVCRRGWGVTACGPSSATHCSQFALLVHPESPPSLLTAPWTPSQSPQCTLNPSQYSQFHPAHTEPSATPPSTL